MVEKLNNDGLLGTVSVNMLSEMTLNQETNDNFMPSVDQSLIKA